MITKCKSLENNQGKKYMLKGLLTELCLIRSVIILVTKQICVDHSYDYSVLGLSWTPLGPIIINFLFSTETMVNQHTM